MKAKRDSPRSEDYLELIYHVIREKGYSGTMEISERLNVSPPTVSSMIAKLAARGYVEHEPYRGVRLTERGENIARSVTKRHGVISELLSMIGVEDNVAYEDTEGIEHHVQPTTIRKIERLAEYFRQNPESLRLVRKFIEAK